MKDNIAPVFEAQMMLEQGVVDDDIVVRLRSGWHLDRLEAEAAIRAARTLLRH